MRRGSLIASLAFVLTMLALILLYEIAGGANERVSPAPPPAAPCGPLFDEAPAGGYYPPQVVL